MTREQLARQVVEVLDLQRRFFREYGPRAAGLLAECKAAERKLRKACDEILRPPQPDAPPLFDNAADAPPAH